MMLPFKAWWTAPSPKEPELKRPVTSGVGQPEDPLDSRVLLVDMQMGAVPSGGHAQGNKCPRPHQKTWH